MEGGNDMVRKLLSIPERQDKALNEMAKKLGISFGELMRRIIDEYIKKNWKEEGEWKACLIKKKR